MEIAIHTTGVAPSDGCLVHTRIVKRAKMPSVVMTATADQLVKVVNDRCKEIHSLSTTVDFQ